MLTPDELDEYLDVLRDKGVTQFSCEAFSVALGPVPQEEGDEVSVNEAIRQAQKLENAPRIARGLFGHPSLFPNGMPQFPGSERATVDHKPTHPDEE